MDDQLRRRIAQFVQDLAVEEQERLSQAGTFVDLELLTAEIGDEIARKLASCELSRRADAVAGTQRHPCPDCGRDCPMEPDREPLILQGYRGEVEYQEPRCHCPRCRRAFFPSGAIAGPRPAHRQLPLMTRVTAPPEVRPPDLAVVMLDGGRYQRRDDFRERTTAVAGAQPADAVPRAAPSPDTTCRDKTCRKTHWHEDKLGLVLSMKSDVHEQDPCPEFPEWLASAPVIAELAQLAERDEKSTDIAAADPDTPDGPSSPEPSADWPDLAPRLLTREVIASSEDSEASTHSGAAGKTDNPVPTATEPWRLDQSFRGMHPELRRRPRM